MVKTKQLILASLFSMKLNNNDIYYSWLNAKIDIISLLIKIEEKYPAQFDDTKQ